MSSLPESAAMQSGREATPRRKLSTFSGAKPRWPLGQMTRKDGMAIVSGRCGEPPRMDETRERAYLARTASLPGGYMRALALRAVLCAAALLPAAPAALAQ